MIPSLNGVCVLGGAQGRSWRCACAQNAVWFVLPCYRCALLAGFLSAAANAGGRVVLLILPCSAPGPRQQMYTGGAPGAVCVTNLRSFLAMKGSEGSASPLGLGCAGSCRRGCGCRAWPEGNGWRKGGLGGSWTACTGGCNTERAPLKKWRQGHQDPSTSSIISGVCSRPGVGAVLQIFCGSMVFNFSPFEYTQQGFVCPQAEW